MDPTFNESTFNLNQYGPMLTMISGQQYQILVGIYNSALTAYIAANVGKSIATEGAGNAGAGVNKNDNVIIEHAVNFATLAVKRTLWAFKQTLFTESNVTGLNQQARAG